MNSKKNVFTLKKENQNIIDRSDNLILKQLFQENNKRKNYFYPIEVIFAIFKVVNLDDSTRKFITKHEDFSMGFFKDLLENNYTNNIFSNTSDEKGKINSTPKFYFDLCNLDSSKILKSFKDSDFIKFFNEKYDLSKNKTEFFR